VIQPTKLGNDIVAMLMPRLKDELTAMYTYRSIANWCENVGYLKAAEFFAKESEDEGKHAKIIEKYLTDWNIIFPLPELGEPKKDFKSLLEAIEVAYNLEYQLYEDYEETSRKIFPKDLCTFNFLNQFLKIQTEAVAEYSTKLNMLQGVEPTKFNLLMLEKKLF
jgi:ferritin